MNNDYVAGALMRERQADYQREIEHDELVAEAHRSDADRDPGADADGAPVAPHPVGRGHERRFRWLMDPRSMTHAHRP
jgi:hypothetical protein